MLAEATAAAAAVWKEARYERLYFRLEKLHALLHEADRRLRKFLRTGHYLHEKPEEAWAAPYVEAALEAERRAEWEAAKTEDLDRSFPSRPDQEGFPAHQGQPSDGRREGRNGDGCGAGACGRAGDAGRSHGRNGAGAGGGNRKPGMRFPVWMTCTCNILRALLCGESVKPYLEKGRWMASVVADTINEWSFDEIGDAILECDGSTPVSGGRVQGRCCWRYWEDREDERRPKKVPKRIAQTILNSLKGGVVPADWFALYHRGTQERDRSAAARCGHHCRRRRFFPALLWAGMVPARAFCSRRSAIMSWDRGFIVADADLSPETAAAGHQGPGPCHIPRAHRQSLHENKA